MANLFTAAEILMFTESRATLAYLVHTRPDLSDGAVFAILNEKDCYRQWIADLATSRLSSADVYSQRLATLFSGFVGPLLCSTVISILRTFSRSLRNTRFNSGELVFSSLIGVSRDMLHVDRELGLLSLDDLIRALCAFNSIFGVDFVIGSSMNPTRMIDVALATDAVTIAGPEAIKRFNNQLKNSITIPHVLNAAEKEQVKREIGDDPVFTASLNLRNDHVVMAALRHAIREVHRQQHRLHSTTQGVKALVVGAAMREVSEFAALSNVHYYFANADAKDTARTSLEVLRYLVKQKRDNLTSSDRKVFAALKSHPKYRSDMPAAEALAILDGLKREKKTKGGLSVGKLVGFQELLRAAENSGGLVKPGSFHFGVNDFRVTKSPDDQFTLLIAQDWGYNATAANWLELFARTDAHQCWGYMALPPELLFEDMPESDIYRFKKFKRRILFDKQFGASPVDHLELSMTALGNGTTEVEWATMTHAFSNGYSHPVSTWGLLLRKPVLSDHRYDFALEVQLENRFGPMVAFSLTRIAKTASIVRTIALPAHSRYVRLLDLPDLVKKMQDKRMFVPKAKLPLTYFSVHADEFYTTLAYAQSLDMKSLNKQVLTTFVKVHRAGASLVSKELKAKWYLKPEDIYRFVHCVYYHALYLQMELNHDISEVVRLDVNWKDRVLGMLAKGLNVIMNATEWLWSWLISERIVDKLVLTMPDAYDQEGCSGITQMRHFGSSFDADAFPDVSNYANDLALTSSFCDTSLMPAGYTIDEWLQEDTTLVRAVYRDAVVAGDLELDVDLATADPDVQLLDKFKAGFRIVTDKDFHAALKDYHCQVKRAECVCPLCVQVVDKCGDQIVDCFHRYDSDFHINISLAELNTFKEQLREEAKEAPENLRKTLEAAMDVIPKSDFQHTVRIEYIKGGPGTGKSRLIRDLADPVRDLIVAPFQKLRVDYKDQSTDERGLVSWEFHTQHRAMLIKNREKVFIDEFTGIPFIIFAIIAYNCQAKTVVLVGDEQQTGVQEGKNEGEPIKKKIDLTNVSRHNLLCNFRNPVLDVHKVNYLFGTRMIPMSSVHSGFTIGKIEDVTKLLEAGYTLMHYSWEATRDCLGDVDKAKKTSVRCNQGSTHSRVVMPVTESDRRLVGIPELSFVSLTRHKDELAILFDDDGRLSPELRQFKLALTTFPDFVVEDNFVTALAFGVVSSAVAPTVEFGDITKRFINIALSVGAFEPAGCDPDAFTAVSDDAVVEPLAAVIDRRLKESVIERLPALGADALIGRDNNCLVVAVADAMGIQLADIHAQLSSSLWYHGWVKTGLVSTRADCENLAAALGVDLRVRLSDAACPTEWKFTPKGAHRIVQIEHEVNKFGGHFYASTGLVVKAVEASRNIQRAAAEMVTKPPLFQSFVDSVRELSAQSLDSVRELSAQSPQWEWSSDGSSLFDIGSSSTTDPLLSVAPRSAVDLDDCDTDAYFQLSGGSRVDDSQQALAADNFGLRRTFVDYATEFVPFVPVSYLMPTDKDFKVLSNTKSKHVKPSYDAYRMISAYEFENCEAYDVPYMNHEMSNVVGEKFVAGQLNMEIMMPTNQRRHPKAQSAEFWSMGTGPALMYFQRNSAQQLQVLQARYLSRRARDLPSFNREKLAKRIANLFVDECMSPNLQSSMTLENLYAITSRNFQDALRKHYDKQMDENNTVNARVYRFQLKDIEKPFKDAVVDLGKAGQGILAWSKEAHVMFMVAFRVLNDIVLKSLQPWVVYDNSMSELEFLEKVNSAMTVTPDCAVNSVIDAAACDSGQNGFTQMIERQIYARLGASEFMLDWYFSFRERYILQAEHVRAPMENVKTSGEPGTLLGNSILMAAILNALVRGSGPFVLVMKGDDGFKRQAAPSYDSDMLMGIKSFCPLDFKIDIDVPITFCGYSLVGGSLYPDIQRKLAKIKTHRFKTFTHFAEYQISLRDWISRIPTAEDELMKFYAVNAELSGRSIAQVEHMFMMIQSVAHIGKNQFEGLYQRTKVDFEFCPGHLKDAPTEMLVQKHDTCFVPMENFLKRQAAKIKYNLK